MKHITFLEFLETKVNGDAIQWFMKRDPGDMFDLGQEYGEYLAMINEEKV